VPQGLAIFGEPIHSTRNVDWLVVNGG
jgi:hypothetical protein